MGLAGSSSGDAQGYSRVKRREFGSNGEYTTVTCNQIQAFFSNRSFAGNFFLYKVHVACDNNELNLIGEERVLRGLFADYKSELGVQDYVFDGVNRLYTPAKLSNNYNIFTVVLVDTPVKKCLKFQVELKHIKSISFQSVPTSLNTRVGEEMEESLSALNVVIRSHMGKQNGQKLKDDQSIDLDHTYMFEIDDSVLGLRHYKHTFKVTEMGLLLNIRFSPPLLCTKAGPVLDFLQQNQGVQTNEKIDWHKAGKTLKNLKIVDNASDQQYRILGLTVETCGAQQFSLDQRYTQGEPDITVFTYYTIDLDIELFESKNIPCICVGSQESPIFLPIELCDVIAHQHYKKDQPTVQQRKSILDHTRVTPQLRGQLLLSDFAATNYGSNTIFKSLGLKFQDSFAITSARVLPAPELKFGKEDQLVPENGRWNFMNKKFSKPSQIKRWAVMNFSSSGDPREIVDHLIQLGHDKGLEIAYPHFIEEEQDAVDLGAPLRMEALFQKLDSSSAPYELILCLLPEKGNRELYGCCKRKSLTEFGIITQCMAPREKLTDRYLTHILLKINVKLGGLNTTLSPSPAIRLVVDTPTMILGVKVCHTPREPRGYRVPSVAAVVSSCGDSISRYRASVRMQRATEEIVQSLFMPESNYEDVGIFRELLLDFYSSSGNQKPEKIIIFRGGISDSQFTRVLNIELDQIVQACKLFDKTWEPQIALIVAQRKSQHTKFFLPKDVSAMMSSVENVAPGTVVEKRLNHPPNNEFYMCAHAATTGTTQPTLYHVLYDSVGINQDDLQQLVHSLSYDCQRSTTSISVVAPIHYAHLAATQVARSMRYDNTYEFSPSMDSTYQMGIPRLFIVHNDVQGSMFFC